MGIGPFPLASEGTVRIRLRAAVSRSLACASFAIALGVFATAMDVPAAAADEPAGVEFAREPGRLRITVDRAPLATYVYADPLISRPYFADVHAPGGIQVTRNHPPIARQDRMDHPEFHPGIWLAFGDLSGNDYWRLKARVVHQAFTRVPLGGSKLAAFSVENQYLNQRDESKIVCREVCGIAITVRPAGYLLLWESTFDSDEEFYFGDQEEMGLGVRVATPLRVERGNGSLPPGTGTMTDSAGRKNGAEIGGNAADWCDYSGTLNGCRVGMTIFCHPQNFRPSWFHARDYGFLAANPFGRAAFRKGEPSKIVVKPGERLRLRYGILLHAGKPESKPDLDTAYADYVRLSRE